MKNVFDFGKTHRLCVSTRLLFLVLALSPMPHVLSQIPQGFNYQAVARDGTGAVLQNTPLQAIMYIQSESTGGTIFWKELHGSVTTNNFGLFTLVVGTGTRQTESTVATFNLIDWSVTPKYLKTEIYYSESWKDMGTSQLYSVPYALKAKDSEQWTTSGTTIYRATGNVGIGTTTPSFPLEVTAALIRNPSATGYTTLRLYNNINLNVRSLEIDYMGSSYPGGEQGRVCTTGQYPLWLYAGTGASLLLSNTGKTTVTSGSTGSQLMVVQPPSTWADDYPLFEVKNKNGISVFSVYNNGVKILVDHTTSKALKGGFAVGGYDVTKAGKTVDFMTISPDSIRFNINNDNVKGLKGGFAVGGYDMTKKGAINQDFMYLTPQQSSYGAYNTFLGYQAGYSSTTGINNVLLGFQAGNKLTSGYNNVSIGYNAGYNNNGYNNTFIGTNAGLSAVSSAAFSNIFIGIAAGRNNFGGKDASNFPFGSSNICIGDSAGRNIQGTGLVQGCMNVFIGYCSGKNVTTGSNNIIIGQSTGSKIVTGNHNLLIGFGASGNTDETGILRIKTMSNTNPPLLFGSFIDGYLRIGGTLEPYSDNGGTCGSSARKWISVYATNGTIQTSDARLKENITDLNYGLESIIRLKPISFTWRSDNDSQIHFGLIAQDVQKVLNEIVDEGSDTSKTLGINYSELIPVLIKGIQEQQHQIRSTNQENQQLKSEVQSLREEMEEIKGMLAR